MKLSRHLLLLGLLLGSPLLLLADEINIFAAASLSDVFKELAPKYKTVSGHTLVFNFGASGTLARQIREGAPADAIFSADELRVDQLEKAGLVLQGTRRTLLLNTLVLIVDASAVQTPAALGELKAAEYRRIAIGEPASVPVGTYTKEHLQKVGLWKPLLDKLVPVDTVRAVLAAVESGNVEAGFVYRTDALISKKVKIALSIPRSEGPRVSYPGAVLREAKHADAAKDFLSWLQGPAAREAFARYGFDFPE